MEIDIKEPKKKEVGIGDLIRINGSYFLVLNTEDYSLLNLQLMMLVEKESIFDNLYRQDNYKLIAKEKDLKLTTKNGN
ncbi:MAG: hypothetical protein ACOCP4_04500 [Candidatus Woesearchaeota archaeon]